MNGWTDPVTRLGLRGNEISLVGRIVAVADSFHAMISDRPYRSAKLISDAFDQLYQGAHVLFDKRVIDALKRAYDKEQLVIDNKIYFY